MHVTWDHGPPGTDFETNLTTLNFPLYLFTYFCFIRRKWGLFWHGFHILLIIFFFSEPPNLYLKVKSMAKINSTLKSPWMSIHVYKHPLWLQHLPEVLIMSWVRHVWVPLFWLIMKICWHNQQGMKWIDWHRSAGTDLVVWQDNLRHWKCLLVIMLSQICNMKFLCLTYSRNDLISYLFVLFLWNHLNTVHMLNT